MGMVIIITMPMSINQKGINFLKLEFEFLDTMMCLI